MKKRLLSLLLVLCMVFTMMPIVAFATEGNVSFGTSSIVNEKLCEHHIAHNEDCGYSPATEEVTCNHKHDEDCGFIQAKDAVPATAGIPCDKECTDTDDYGVIKHIDDCAYTPAVAEIPAVEGMSCGHEHDENCGYAPASEGIACGFVCEECEQAQEEPALFNLPRSLTSDLAVTTSVTDGYTYADGVMTFTKAGEYTVAMKSGVTSTWHRIVVNASGVTLNLNGITISALQGAPSSDGLTALAVTDGTILNITADSSLSGGVAGPGGYPSGGTGIRGNVVIKGSATLTAIGGHWNSNYNDGTGEYSKGGNGITGTVDISGNVTLIANGGGSGSQFRSSGVGNGGMNILDCEINVAAAKFEFYEGSSANSLIGVPINYNQITQASQFMKLVPISYRITALDLNATSGSYRSTDGTVKTGVNFTTTSVTDSDEGWSWNHSTKTLTLSGLDLRTGEEKGLIMPNSGDSTIVLTADTESTILCGDRSGSGTGMVNSFGIYAINNLTLEGTGTLNVTSGNVREAGVFPGTPCDSFGIFTGKMLSIKGGIINVTSGNASGNADKNGQSTAISATTGLNMTGGNVTANGGDATLRTYGISVSNNKLSLTGGIIRAKNGTGGSLGAAAIANTAVSGKLLIGSISAPATITNATDGTETITKSNGEISSKKLVMAGGEAITITFSPLPTATEYAVGAINKKDTGDYFIDTTTMPQTLHIYTAKGAAFWSANGGSYLDYAICLDNDIDVSLFLWSPVGNGNPFNGMFDGQKHRIYGLTIDSVAQYVGLFQATGGTALIQNLCIASGSVNGTFGGVGDLFVGGIVGYTGNSTIRNCCNHATICGENSGNQNYDTAKVGGIVGTATSRDTGTTTIINCFNTGSITATGAGGNAIAGGIVGNTDNNSSFTNCYNTGTITADGSTSTKYAGAISGFGGKISNCYSLIDCVTAGTGGQNGTVLTSEQMKSETGATNALIDSLNAWVNTQKSSNYYTWESDSSSNPTNGGYPVFGDPYVEIEAKWGNDNTYAVGNGNFADAVAYAYGLTSGTAYIQLQSDVRINKNIYIGPRGNTILDLNGKTINGNNSSHSGFLVNGKLTICDNSTNDLSKQGKITGCGSCAIAVSGSNATLIMTGGNIIGNISTSHLGGGVSADGGATIELSGNINISGNKANDEDRNLFIMFSSSKSAPIPMSYITLGDTLANTTPIGVSIFEVERDGAIITLAPAMGVFTKGDTVINSNYASKFTSDNIDFTIAATADNQLELTDGTVSYKPVTDITGVPTTAIAGTDLTLTGTVAPTDATNKTIVWNVKTAGTAGATISDGKLKTTATGTVKVTATITNGLTASSDYIKDFDIVVSAASVSEGTVSGKVTDSEGNPIRGARVVIIGTPSNDKFTDTDSSGNYSIENVPFGIYSIYVNKNTFPKVAFLDRVDIYQSSVVKDMQFLDGKKSLEIEISSGIHKSISVSGILEHYDTYLSNEEKTAIIAGGQSLITLLAIKKEPSAVASDKALIESVATGKSLGYFVDLSVLKTVKDVSNNTITNREILSTIANAISVTILIPTELQGKDGITAYRVHNGAAQTLAKDTADANGEYFTISVDGKYITIYTKHFSTYAIGYTTSITPPPSGGGGGGSSYDYYDIKITKEGNGTISPDGVSNHTVSVREGREQTFTFTPDKGYVVSDVLVDGKSIGAKASYTFKDVTKDHTLKVIFKKSDGHENPQTGVDFEDVAEKDWFNDSVVNAVAKGWFAGTSDTTFSPYLSTTRGMIATVLYRMENEPTASATSIFQDVLQGKWYYNGVSWAQNHDIVKGYGNGKYGPNDEITREQLASILYRYAQFKGYDVSLAANLDGFSDGNTVSAYATKTMKWAVGTNLISGKPGGILDPRGKATRAEVATILTRFDEMFTK